MLGETAGGELKISLYVMVCKLKTFEMLYRLLLGLYDYVLSNSRLPSPASKSLCLIAPFDELVYFIPRATPP